MGKDRIVNFGKAKVTCWPAGQVEGFYGLPPERIGDDCMVYLTGVNGYRKVRLLHSTDMPEGVPYLVDLHKGDCWEYPAFLDDAPDEDDKMYVILLVDSSFASIQFVEGSDGTETYIRHEKSLNKADHFTRKVALETAKKFNITGLLLEIKEVRYVEIEKHGKAEWL